MKSNLRLLLILVIVTAFAGVLMVLDNGNGNLANEHQADFAIADTSKVTKIFIADTHGVSALIERSSESRYWTLNGKFFARKDASDLILKTFFRAKVKGPVPEKQRETVIRLLAGSGKKVEIYEGGDKPVKIWYVGTATPSHTGTYMLLETPENGKSSEPFIIHLEGFVGFLSTRFFTDENEWKYTGVFDYPGRTLAEVSVQNHEFPAKSFSILTSENGKVTLENGAGAVIGIKDTIKVQDHFLRFRKVHFESFNSHLNEEAQDELRTSSPALTIRCNGFDGRSSRLDLYWKSTSDPSIEHDGEHMYGLTSDGQVVLVQRYVFDPLIVGLSDFN